MVGTAAGDCGRKRGNLWTKVIINKKMKTYTRLAVHVVAVEVYCFNSRSGGSDSRKIELANIGERNDSTFFSLCRLVQSFRIFPYSRNIIRSIVWTWSTQISYNSECSPWQECEKCNFKRNAPFGLCALQWQWADSCTRYTHIFNVNANYGYETDRTAFNACVAVEIFHTEHIAHKSRATFERNSKLCQAWVLI